MCSRAVLPDELVLAHSGPWRLAFLAAAGPADGPRARYVTGHHVDPHGPAGCLGCRRRPDVGARPPASGSEWPGPGCAQPPPTSTRQPVQQFQHLPWSRGSSTHPTPDCISWTPRPSDPGFIPPRPQASLCSPRHRCQAISRSRAADNTASASTAAPQLHNLAMATRGPPGGRGMSNRFAQFKLVLLGEMTSCRATEPRLTRCR
jgi:hypothetical protein